MPIWADMSSGGLRHLQRRALVWLTFERGLRGRFETTDLSHWRCCQNCCQTRKLLSNLGAARGAKIDGFRAPSRTPRLTPSESSIATFIWMMTGLAMIPAAMCGRHELVASGCHDTLDPADDEWLPIGPANRFEGVARLVEDLHGVDRLAMSARNPC